MLDVKGGEIEGRKVGAWRVNEKRDCVDRLGKGEGGERSEGKKRECDCFFIFFVIAPFGYLRVHKFYKVCCLRIEISVFLNKK